MTKQDEKRAQLVAKLADHVLDAGLEDTGLRRLAEIAGTSDRMLIYYFGTKDALITAILLQIGGGLQGELDALLSDGPLAPDKALIRLWSLLKSDLFARQLRLWLDLASRASRGHALYGAVVAQIAEGWITWVANMLDAPDTDTRALAVLMMAAMDGQLMLFPTDLAQGDAAINALAELLQRPG